MVTYTEQILFERSRSTSCRSREEEEWFEGRGSDASVRKRTRCAVPGWVSFLRRLSEDI